MLAILQLVLKGGFKTSEFWVTAAGLVLTLVSPFVPGWVNSLHAQQVEASPVTGFALGIAAAIISGTYTIARTILKKGGVDAAAVVEAAPADPVVSSPPANAMVIRTPSGNLMTPLAGGAALEEAHRQAIVTATKALADAHEALVMASNLPHPSTFGAAAAIDKTAPDAGRPASGAASSSSPGTTTGGV